jgi:hypothetical protein
MSQFDELVRTTLDMVKKAQEQKGIDTANALDSANWNAKLNRIAEKDKLDAAVKASDRNYDKAMAIEQAKTDRQDSVNQRYLDVQALRNEGGVGGSGSGSGSGKRKDGKPTDEELMKHAFSYAEKNPGMPGQPGITPEEMFKRAKQMRDGTPAERAAAAKALEATTAATAAPSTPTALNTKDWSGYGKAYADQQTAAGRTDVQAPMKFEGLQPGMVGDQIGRFRKADGSVHFANAAAVRNAAPAPVITPIESTVNRDAGLRSAPAPTAVTPAAKITPTPAGTITPDDASGINRAGWNDIGRRVLGGTNWTDASLGAGMTRDTGEEPSAPKAPYVAPSNAISVSPGAGTKGLGLDFAKDRTPVYPTNPESTSPGPTTAETISDMVSPMGNAANSFANALPAIPSGVANAVRSLNQPGTSTNPLMPNYSQEPAAIEPLATPKGLLDWWKEKSGRRMPTKRDANPRRDTFFNLPESSTNPLFPNYKP